MNKVPAFAYMGGKARLRDWLYHLFPKSGNRYLEPFAGRGNVFFLMKTKLKFNQWFLSDIKINFLIALLKVDLNTLPDKVSRNDFKIWRNRDTFTSIVIEPAITYSGKGYNHNYQPDSYNVERYRYKCELARKLLVDVNITRQSYTELNYDELTSDDFVYFDPPYINTKASYPNIDHKELIEILNTARYKWAVSGYPSDLYSGMLSYKNKYIRSKFSTMKNIPGQYATECLWTNY